MIRTRTLSSKISGSVLAEMKDASGGVRGFGSGIWATRNKSTAFMVAGFGFLYHFEDATRRKVGELEKKMDKRFDEIESIVLASSQNKSWCASTALLEDRVTREESMGKETNEKRDSLKSSVSKKIDQRTAAFAKVVTKASETWGRVLLSRYRRP